MPQKMKYNITTTYEHKTLGTLIVEIWGEYLNEGPDIIPTLNDINCTAWDEESNEYPDAYRTRVIDDDTWFHDTIMENAEYAEEVY